ncbi:hypothetical protein LGM65_30290 [Burkholderia anthina]|uniref:hypothetical protein n=1 Tax=Burkholderia anthina TaxID=179879 RepID=UPI001CF194AB|nr:hypothetical protein [Burkholderia anthina]MCA8095113.1 hypothetical protein [Burkholderia anthina]
MTSNFFVTAANSRQMENYESGNSGGNPTSPDGDPGRDGGARDLGFGRQSPHRLRQPSSGCIHELAVRLAVDCLGI